MRSKPPLVSMGLPVYNGEKYIRQALDSLLDQTYKNFELIISDNGSTDRTQEICLKYVARDKRIRYYRNETNMGVVWNFNRVFELSSGEYFMWASHDDYWDSRYLQSCLGALDASEDVILAAAMCEVIDPEKEKLIFTDQGFSTIGLDPRERFMRYMLMVYGVYGNRHSGGIFYGIYKRSALRKVMPIRFKVLAGDHLILAELCFHGEFVTVQGRLMVKRWRGASTSLGDSARVLGINNQLLITYPYFVREVLLQRIIFHTDMLTLPDKIRLGGWSLGNYIRVYGVSTLRCLVIWLLPAFAKRLIIRAKKYLASGRKPRRNNEI